MVVVALFAAVGGFVVASKLGSPDTQLVPEQPPSPESLLGQMRPDFLLTNLAGETLSAGDFDGQVLLLNFWATWCKPWVEEMPRLSRIAEGYASEGFVVLGVAVDDPQKARDFVSELKLSYPITVGATESAVTGRRYGCLLYTSDAADDL